MSRKIFLYRSQTQTIPEVEIRKVKQVDGSLVNQMTKLKCLRTVPIDQKDNNCALKDQLKRSTDDELIEQRLRQHKATATCKQMFSKNVEIGLVAANNNATAMKDGSPHDHIRRQQQRNERGDVEIRVISSNVEQQHEQPEDSRLTSEHGMQLESSPSEKQVLIVRKRKNIASESNVVEWEVHTTEEQQCNQRDNSTESESGIVLANHLTEEAVPHPKTTNPVVNPEKSEGASRSKKHQLLLTRKDCEASFSNTPKHRQRSKTYSCTECAKAFIRKDYLIKHLRTHTGEKPFKCGECGDAFSQASHLTQHQRTHSDEKPFECQICNVNFRQKAHLSRHSLIHVNEKPFKCDVCKRPFRRKESWTDHMNTHSGRRPHQCSVCKKTYLQYSSLSRHRRIHATDEE